MLMLLGWVVGWGRVGQAAGKDMILGNAEKLAVRSKSRSSTGI